MSSLQGHVTSRRCSVSTDACLGSPVACLGTPGSEHTPCTAGGCCCPGQVPCLAWCRPCAGRFWPSQPDRGPAPELSGTLHKPQVGLRYATTHMHHNTMHPYGADNPHLSADVSVSQTCCSTVTHSCPMSQSGIFRERVHPKMYTKHTVAAQ